MQLSQGAGGRQPPWAAVGLGLYCHPSAPAALRRTIDRTAPAALRRITHLTAHVPLLRRPAGPQRTAAPIRTG